ncbi:MULTISPECIES: polyprenyl diphosphate synthase [Brevibacterium]|jgi:short-chain Z-isoprenyl diphosphate synthase|uniref:Isoprenyl transferase n=1 Tax=Brevibacterium salitolerans TaxID=1403566 RepID=A0ABN2WBS0_9MICO|nr:polyprenyl diphosphate synthase [Brevibacterium sp.]
MQPQPPRWLYRLYNRRIAAGLEPTGRLPRHVGVITDGNRRWAKEFGQTTADGHRAGAQRILQFIDWCDELGIEVVTLYVLSKENLQRSEEEVSVLGAIIGDLVDDIAGRDGCEVRLVGDLGLLPEGLRERLTAAARSSAGRENGREPARIRVNIAAGYGGRQEIVTAVRELLREGEAAGMSLSEAIESVTEQGISEHLYTKGQPDPDLIIRSSGEQRLSGFLIWQSAYTEFYFCEVYWPAFRRTDFLRALRDYAERGRRYGK